MTYNSFVKKYTKICWPDMVKRRDLDLRQSLCDDFNVGIDRLYQIPGLRPS